MESKRYYWLKLHDDFFSSKRIKKLRKMAGGDTFTIIYLKMQLMAMKNNGIIRWDGIEQTLAEELALDLDEEVENVQITLSYLVSCGLAETDDSLSIFLPYSVENVGSESSSAQRVREHREKQKTLHCNNSVTEVKQICNGEIEIEKDIDIDIEIDKEKEINKEKEGRKRFAPPSVSDVESYILEKGYHFNAEDFVAYYDSNGWKVGRNSMKDWKSACRTWESRYKPNTSKLKTGKSFIEVAEELERKLNNL